MSNYMLAHASTGTNTPDGDDSGKEVCVRDFYNPGWECILRPLNTNMISRSTEFAITVCNNNNIGYSQLKRNELYEAVKKRDWKANSTDIKEKLSCDCSSFITTLAIVGGAGDLMQWFIKTGNCPTTSNMKVAFIRYASDYLIIEYNKNIKEGDIVLKKGSHVAYVLKRNNALYSYHVRDLQSCINDDTLFELKEDGLYGKKTDTVLKSIVCKNEMATSIMDINAWVQIRIGLQPNGVYDERTKEAVKEYQVKKHLNVDGQAGYNTIRSLLMDCGVNVFL